ncbi:hypothetical protein CCP2SC5_10078 [Azospirillaceae bacterium]
MENYVYWYQKVGLWVVVIGTWYNVYVTLGGSDACDEIAYPLS